MNIVSLAVRQPVTIAVGVLLILLAGMVSVGRLPIQLTPNVDDTIISVQTLWEGASPQEIEQEIVDAQEDKLEGISNLVQMTSESLQGLGRIKLQFQVGTPKEEALREVSDKLRQVPDYPENTEEPVVEASDPENRDYIAWIVLETPDPNFDIRTLQDFAQDRVQPVLERVPGMAEVNVLGGVEREAQIRFDPRKLAQRGIPLSEFIAVLQRTNRNVSAGELPDGKSDVRVRTVSQFDDVDKTLELVLRNDASGVVRVRDVAEVVETHKEARAFVRSRGRPVIAINCQREIDANVIEVMAGLRTAIAKLNQPGGLLELEGRRRGLEGGLILEQVYDQTIYIDDALALVQSNIWIGGTLAILVLLLFLRSFRSAGIVALAIPISVVGAIVAMVTLGRSVNVISLAGMAFAVGMVVDNAIVVLENIHRHLEMGKSPRRAALDGANEVWGAVLAATLTTIVVFIPILLIEEEAGQLFRDIALAICAAVGLSLVVSVTVIPTIGARLLRQRKSEPEKGLVANPGAKRGSLIADWIGGTVEQISRKPLVSLIAVIVLSGASFLGSSQLMPPADYLPSGNQNLVFGLMIPPSGYNLDQKLEIGTRVESAIRPYFEAGKLDPGSAEAKQAAAELPPVPTFNMATMSPGPSITPPPLENYFVVSFEDIVFHGAISQDPKRVVDVQALLNHAARSDVNPGTFAFAFQIPLFRQGGNSGTAVNVDLTGDDLEQVSQSTGALFGALMGPPFGPTSIQPSPANFLVPGPELRVVPDSLALQRIGMTPEDLGLAVQMFGDGRIIGGYRLPGGETIDLKVISQEAAAGATSTGGLAEIPVATPSGSVVPLGSLATLERVGAAQQINRIARQRSVSLQVSPPENLPLEAAIRTIQERVAGLQETGVIPPTVDVSYSGSASKLQAVEEALLGDGTLFGTLGSSLVLALIVVYLLLCVLFQSFVEPFVILFSVPFATFGGFAALAAVSAWSEGNRYLPTQKLDVLTMLGFVILIGVVVNNAILIVHQALNFMGRGREDEETRADAMDPNAAIGAAVKSRVRPIFMGMFTSVGGMMPLVLMPGSGSELYRGLGGVVIGGLLVSTLFTLVLVPLLLSLTFELRARIARARGPQPAAGAAALLLVTLPWLVGCSPTVPRGEGDRDLTKLVEGIMARELSSASTGVVGSSRFEPTAVAPFSTDRELLQNLDEIGGDAAFFRAKSALGDDLRGLSTERETIEIGDAVRRAVEHGLGIRLARIDVEIAETDREQAESEFDLEFFSTASFRKTDEPQRVPVLGGVLLGTPVNASEQETLAAGFRQRISTGATVSAEARLERFENDTRGIDFDPDPAYSTVLSVGVTQPLLRDRGAEVATADIALAENDRVRRRLVLRSEVVQLVRAVEEAYWSLAFAEQSVLVRERLLEQGEEVREVLEARRNFDTRPAEIADAVATVEERRAAVVAARRSLRRASDQLKAVLDDPALPLGGEVVLETGTLLAEEAPEFTIDLAAALRTALAERPEIEAAVLTIEDAALRETVARNLRLPRLDLNAEVGLVGLDDDFAEATREWTSDRFVDGLIGLTFEVPIGNRGPRAAERRAQLERNSAELALRRTIRNVVEEVKGTLRDVRTEFELLEATRNLRLAATENLRALLAEEEARAALTPEFLTLKFRRQERLASARLEEITARARVRQAIARFRGSIGALPEFVGEAGIESK